MKLANYYQKVKQWAIANQSDLFIAVLIFLVGITSFGLGRLSILWPAQEPLTIENVPVQPDRGETVERIGTTAPSPAAVSKASPRTLGKYVASKSGKNYHLPWCPGAQKIKEENKIWFQTREEATARGYTPAGNCPGL